MRVSTPLMAGLAVLALAGGTPSAQARPAPNGPEVRTAPVSLAIAEPRDNLARYATAFPIAGVIERDGAYYLDIDLRALQREGFDTYATVGGGNAGFARLSAGVITSAPLTGALFDGWSLFGMTGYGRRTDTSALRILESGNQWVSGVGLGYRF